MRFTVVAVPRDTVLDTRPPEDQQKLLADITEWEQAQQV